MNRRVTQGEVREYLRSDQASQVRNYLADGFSEMLTVGVTGTKGKTSTSFFAAQLFESNGCTVALLADATAVIAGAQVAYEASLAGLPIFLEKCRAAAVDVLIVELPSTALAVDVHHLFSVNIGVITNVGAEHVRQHGNIRNYVQAKGRLIRDLVPLRVEGSTLDPCAVLNATDPRLRTIGNSQASPCRTFWLEGDVPLNDRSSRLCTTEIAPTEVGTDFVLTLSPGPAVSYCRTKVLGRFNVSNIVSACAAFVASGRSLEQAAASLDSLVPPLGRFEVLPRSSSQAPTVVVDYAHSEDSLARVLATCRELWPAGFLTAVVGCGGNSRKAKRRRMGGVAAGLADRVILTADNPGWEEPASIASDMMRGLNEPAQERIVEQPDRGRAIEEAIQQSCGGDVVIILGRGSEQYQRVRGIDVPFSDRGHALQALERAGHPCP